MQTPEITLSNTDLFVEFPPIVTSGGDAKRTPRDRIAVSGVVVDEKDNPIPAVHVEVMYDLNGLMSRETITDSEGRWRLPLPLWASNIIVRLKHPDFISYHFDDRCHREPSLAELQTGQCKLVMKRGFTATGIVRSQKKDPVENVLVTAGRFYTYDVYGMLNEDGTTARTAKDGSFSISGLPADKIDLMILSDGFSPKIIGVDMKNKPTRLPLLLRPAEHTADR